MTASPDPVDVDDDMTFGDAIVELTEIVTELESDSVDVDDLAARVERAAALVQWCRERIDGARFKVDEILVRLDPGELGDPG